MGFLMMATLLWLLYVLGKQLGMEALVWTGAFLLTVAIALWSVGRFATLSATRRRTYTTWVIAAAIVVGGYWYFIEHTLNVRALVAGTMAPVPAGPDAGNDSGIAWEPFTLAGLEEHLQKGSTVFVDFTAEWCLTCKVNEKTVLADDAVVQKFRSSGVVAIKADWTTRNPDITRLLQKFGRSGVPLYVLFPAGRPSEPIVLPEVITSGVVLDALESVR
jgi:thiol:disulfide interchange protein DsbD